MKNITSPLMPGVFYHIYNRGNNRENLFFEQRNYPYFLGLYTKYIEPVAETYAYCLMKNHFHLLVRVKTEEEFLEQTSQVFKTCEVYGEARDAKLMFNPSQRFSNLFNAYSKSINKAYGRTGSLFEERFGRIPITRDSHYEVLIFYIHFNPQKHGFVKDFRDWQWSSYQSLIGKGVTRLKRAEVIEIYGNPEGFVNFHQGLLNDKLLERFIDDEFDNETGL